jgi:hypothetical protein
VKPSLKRMRRQYGKYARARRLIKPCSAGPASHLLERYRAGLFTHLTSAQ